VKGWQGKDERRVVVTFSTRAAMPELICPVILSEDTYPPHVSSSTYFTPMFDGLSSGAVVLTLLNIDDITYHQGWQLSKPKL
jgi:hypothetical protein